MIIRDSASAGRTICDDVNSQAIARQQPPIRETQMTYEARRFKGLRDEGRSIHNAQQGVFRKEGEYWTIGYGTKAFRLKETRGLVYLAHLLRHPNTEFHVLDLVGGIASQGDGGGTGPSLQGLPRGIEPLERAGIHVTRLGDAGEILDNQAKLAYKRRLFELREQLEEAKELGNVERAESAEQEIDVLTLELSRAVGLQGRNRRAASASERARQSVTKSIKSVVGRVAQSDATLGDIFSRFIRTGIFCSYQPNPDFPIVWEFGAPDADLTVAPVVQAIGSGDPASSRTDHRKLQPAVLEASPFSFGERTAFVGRDSEAGVIRAVIDRARNGHGSVVMLAGGPGVGKTRLAMEMLEYASRVGFQCSVGHSYERDEPFPYSPVAEIIESNLAQCASLDDFRRLMGDNAAELAQVAPSLRRIFPDIPQPPELPPGQERLYLFQSISEPLARAARRRPSLYLLEDLHWAEESTLSLFMHLANRLAHVSVVIIGTYRGEYSDDNPALTRTLEELIQIGIRPLKLNGLSKDAVARMLHALSHREAPRSLVNLVFEVSQGNPFFVEEIHRHLIEEGKLLDAAGQFRADIEIDEIDVPENVRLTIGRRLKRLDEDERQVLTAAAVIGRSFSFQLLSAISLIDVDELFTVVEKAQRMGIIVPSAEGPEKPFTFGHELVRQTLLTGISAPRQQQLHARVAAAIELVYPAAVHECAAEMADHLLRAGSFADAQRLVHWLTLAGKGALEVAAFEEARRNFRSALSHQTASDIGERADLLANLAIAERSLGLWDATLADLREALDIYINLGNREMIGRIFNELTDTLKLAGRFQQAMETAQRGLDYLNADVNADRAYLLATVGQAHAAVGHYEPAHKALREGLDIASELSDSRLEARLLGSRSIVNFHFFRLEEAAADGFLSEQLGGSEVSPSQRGAQLRVLQETLLNLGRPEEALRIVGQLEPLACKIGQPYSLVRCLSLREWVEFGKALDLVKLEAAFQQVPKPYQEVPFGPWEALLAAQLSLVNFYRGNWESALFHARTACRFQPSPIEGFGDGLLLRQMAYAGNRDEALAILDQKRSLLPISGQPNIGSSWWMLINIIEGLVVLGEQSQAGRLYPLVRELIGTGAVAFFPILRFTQTIAGVAAGAARLWDAADVHFRIALQQAESFPHILEQAEIRRFHAMMLKERAAPGDSKKARILLREAMPIYTRAGMLRHIEITHALLDEGFDPQIRSEYC
jgi:tetratricopeptide (TPR) repeat protein